MEISFSHREVAHKGAWVVVFAIALTYVAAIAHGVVTIDVARDLYWAIEIASGRAWPAVGPPIGPFELLSAFWYYVAAFAAALSSSLTMYFALLGALAALKFVLMYRVAQRWVDTRFALTVVVAATLPGVVSYQFFGISHTQFVEATIWATALFVLRLRASPESTRDALALGLCAALALHAHPTTIFLLPWAAVAIFRLPTAYRLRAALLSFFAAAAVFLPFLIALALRASPLSENINAAAGLHGALAGLPAILKNLFWFQTTYVVETTLPLRWVAPVWPTLWSLLLVVSAFGAVMAAIDRQLRRTFWATLLTLLALLVAITLLRDHTPFYMLYVALPPLAVLYALAWTALRKIRRGAALNAGLIMVVVALHFAVSLGYVFIARTGLVASRLPLHSDMKNTATTTHPESVDAAPTRDAIASWLCTQPGTVALHGDVAATYDIGLGMEPFFHCRNRTILATSGGAERAWTGLPLPVWHAISVVPQVVRGTYGLNLASHVISPVVGLPQVDGRAYPPRLALMISAASYAAWRTQIRTNSSALLVVSSLLPTYPLFIVAATANGVAQQPLSQFANTVVFRCDRCAELTAIWDISVQSGAPESTSITVLDAPSAPTKSSP